MLASYGISIIIINLLGLIFLFGVTTSLDIFFPILDPSSAGHSQSKCSVYANRTRFYLALLFLPMIPIMLLSSKIMTLLKIN
jgi:hypothetical protein